MSQEQLNTIVKILRNGAPALADELIDSVVNLIQVNQKLRSDNDELRKKVESLECTCTKEAEEDK